MPLSLTQALEAEVRRQGIAADQIHKLELDQKCRAVAIQVSGFRSFVSCCQAVVQSNALQPHSSSRTQHLLQMLGPSIFLRRA